LQDIISAFFDFFTSLLSPVATPPYSAVFIIVVSVALALISIVVTQRVSDVEQLQEDMDTVKQWQAKFNEARKNQDPQMLQEVVDSQSQIMSIQGRMMKERCKPMLIFYIPFLLVFAILAAVYGANIVVILPFNPQKLFPFLEGFIGSSVPGAGFGMTFFYWYLLASLGLSTLIRKFVNMPMI
jgi:uncharacterized membrane protein (DUF106 family)